MSSYSIDVSGGRPLNLTVNDPARTGATVTAKQGDDLSIQLGGAREIRVAIGDGAGVRVQRRRYVSRSQKVENGRAVRDAAGAFVYEEREYDMLYLVLGGSAAIFARTSRLPDETPEQVPHEGWPHMQLSARRTQDGDRSPTLHFSESGELVEELNLADLIAGE